MNDSWKKFSPPFWPSPFGANYALPTIPARSTEPWTDPWPTILAQTLQPPSTRPNPTPPMQPIDERWSSPWANLWPTNTAHTAQPLPLPSSLPIAPARPQGGLLASLNDTANGGLPRSLAQPWPYLGSVLAAARPSLQPPTNDFYPSPIPRAPSWNPAPSYPAARSTQTFPTPQRQFPWSVPVRSGNFVQGTSSGGEAYDIPEVLSDATPDNYWIPGAEYAADGHHEFPREHYNKMPPETRKVFAAAKTGRLFIHSIDGRRHEFDVFHRRGREEVAKWPRNN
jgi:hypothetical protein